MRPLYSWRRRRFCAAICEKRNRINCAACVSSSPARRNYHSTLLKHSKRTADVLHDGWLKTGDLGRFDEDGFLYIEGRLSRFSKIGGEMVPHESIEQRIYNSLGIAGESDRLIALVGVPDQAKGEALVL